MTKGSYDSTPARFRMVPIRERLPMGQLMAQTFRSDGVIFVHVSPEVRTIEDLCKVFTEIGTKAMNSPFWSHASARGWLSNEFIANRNLPEPVVYHELSGPAIVEIRSDLSVDEALARLMPLFNDEINKRWKLSLSDGQVA
ncbi:hypothetical protein [Actinomadura rugatobispora]|uniref:Uncharacterized protein n=1 Tax=Actinomadura rugatobispora TaxID=1994 RepID=A0ABW1A7N8_9ACTN|nr:hypothetical protein GCM10010200_026190 [Actinomadura rugatobispora]